MAGAGNFFFAMTSRLPLGPTLPHFRGYFAWSKVAGAWSL